MTHAIEVRDLVVVLGSRRILHGLTFTVPTGQVTGLRGPSGCGKTTLMRCVVGVQQISSGCSGCRLGQRRCAIGWDM
jgi:ABC-2 type transport system ATP-binding protein